ncbi:MAG: thioredoxin family protein [Opitutaceae bacterium]|nr:thioredoxin family protein [Opitutaceae bacterium]
MRRLLSLLFVLSLVARAVVAAPLPLEKEVADLAAGSQVTVVHLWAPWCPNCRTELRPDGWAKFIGANPAVKFVFVNVWHNGDAGTAILDQAVLGAQPNFLARMHPNGTRKGDGRMTKFLDLPVAWIPATWIYREGQLCYALDYGEVRFPMLQQMIDDARADWSH